MGFTDERFEVDKEDDAFRLIQPVVSKLDNKQKEFERKYGVKNSDSEDNNSGDSDMEMDSEGEESSDDDTEWTKQLKSEHKNIQKEKHIEKINKKLADKEKKLMQKIKPSRPAHHTFSEVSN